MKQKIVVLGLLIFVLFSCDSSPKQHIAKKWRISVEEMVKLLPKDKRELYNKYTEEQKKEAKLAMESAIWEFKEDGNFELTNKNDKSKPKIKGKWSLSEDNKSLTITSEGKQDVMRVSHISANKLIIEGENGFVFVPAK
ncbi:MAG: lipocalin family protein [Microscillaceae bacterium]|nr:lipocalin family protein [Microscillaceae bacterium]MDW8460271.1 lipocalin family protein [Cytophagales bacterium]